MGIFDFFKTRQNDFVKLETTSIFGPGPIILLFNVPQGIQDDEIQDMVQDGAPIASSTGGDGGVKISRLDSSSLANIENTTVQVVLEKALNNELPTQTKATTTTLPGTGVGSIMAESSSSSSSQVLEVPILYFSGISNEEMMKTYNIIAREIYDETGGVLKAACAKAVPPAMKKCFKQLVDEITGDHLDAIQAAPVAASDAPEEEQ